MNRRSSSVASSKKTKRVATASASKSHAKQSSSRYLTLASVSATSIPSTTSVSHRQGSFSRQVTSSTSRPSTQSSVVVSQRSFAFRASPATHARTPLGFEEILDGSADTQQAKIRKIKEQRALEELVRNNPNDDDIYASSSSTEWTSDQEGNAKDFDHRVARVSLKARQKIRAEDVRKHDEDRIARGPSQVQRDQAQEIIDTLEKRFTVDDEKDERFDFLDPLNPPNLTYEHVKLLKNIDYSPLIRRAKEGGMFTVEDVISILQSDGTTNKFKSGMRREHLQDPFIFEETFDLFNKGKKPCPLCLPDPTPTKENKIHYTNVNLLRKYISTTGLILPRRVSGVCSKHQNKLRFAIKNAKQLALLSFTSNWHVPLSYTYPDKYPSYDDQDAAADVERIRRREIKDLYDNLRDDKLEMITKMRISNASLPAGAAPGDLVTGPTTSTNRSIEEIIKSRITEDMGESEIERITQEEIRRDELRRDMGDLVDLNKFDLDMSFDQFVARYNATVAAKKPKALAHDKLFIEDSSDSDDPLIEAYAPLDTTARTKVRREAEEAYRRKDKDE